MPIEMAAKKSNQCGIVVVPYSSMKIPWLLCALAIGLVPAGRAEQLGKARRVLAGDDSTHRLAIVAPDGSVEWEVKVGAIHDAAVLENGNILFQQGWQKIVEMTPAKEIVWEYDAGKMNGNEGKPEIGR